MAEPTRCTDPPSLAPQLQPRWTRGAREAPPERSSPTLELSGGSLCLTVDRFDAVEVKLCYKDEVGPTLRRSTLDRSAAA
jgi:hypothetical protein